MNFRELELHVRKQKWWRLVFRRTSLKDKFNKKKKCIQRKSFPKRKAKVGVVNRVNENLKDVYCNNAIPKVIHSSPSSSLTSNNRKVLSREPISHPISPLFFTVPINPPLDEAITFPYLPLPPDLEEFFSYNPLLSPLSSDKENLDPISKPSPSRSSYFPHFLLHLHPIPEIKIQE